MSQFSLQRVLNSPLLGDTGVVLRFSRGEHHGGFSLKTKIRDRQCVESFFSEPSCEFRVHQACPTSTEDDASCPVLQTT